MRDQPPPRAASRTSNNRFESARWRQQHMTGDPRSMIRVVLRDRLAIHGDDLKGLSLKFQVHVAIRGSVRDPPELSLTGRNFNLRPHGPVHRHDLLRRLLLATTNVRTKVNALLQIGRLRIILNGTPA